MLWLGFEEIVEVMYLMFGYVYGLVVVVEKLFVGELDYYVYFCYGNLMVLVFEEWLWLIEGVLVVFVIVSGMVVVFILLGVLLGVGD